MKAAIITIGDEILIGQTIDTNSGYIAKALDQIGIQTIEIISISDTQQHIKEALKNYQNKVDIVLITGGLGPTKDDITKKTLCDYFEDYLVENQEVLTHVTHLISTYLKKPLSDLNRAQALVPSRALVLKNLYGTAPGMWLQKEQTVFISMPGVPYEMKGIMQHEVIPLLAKKFQRPFIIHKTILTYGVGESVLAEQIAEWENKLPPVIKLAYLPSPGRVKLRLTARGNNQQQLQDIIDSQVQLLEPLIVNCLVGYDEDQTIEHAVGALLSNHKLTFAAAESCTGGKIAALVTAVPGCSNWFLGSAVTYATQSKSNLLHIPQDVIHKHSVVSAPVAEAMANAARNLFKTDYAVATTGNAGPTKGDADADLGTVYISVAGHKETVTEVFSFGQPREKVMLRAANKALEMLRREILKNVK